MYSQYYIFPVDFSINRNIVSVNALQSVVSMTANDVITPLCPRFFAMTKQLLVVGLPSITRMAMSFSSLKPNISANGRKTAQRSTSLIKAIPAVTRTFPFVSLKLNEAPSAMRERGVAIFPRYETDFERITG